MASRCVEVQGHDLGDGQNLHLKKRRLERQDPAEDETLFENWIFYSQGNDISVQSSSGIFFWADTVHRRIKNSLAQSILEATEILFKCTVSGEQTACLLTNSDAPSMKSIQNQIKIFFIPRLFRSLTKCQFYW